MRLVLLPGMGVDHRLFDPQRDLPVPFTVPPWPVANSRDSLEDYADRFAAEVGPCDAIGGVSFGGVMAQAMASKVGAKVVIGISTARHGRQIPGTIRFAQALAALVKGEHLELFGAIPDRFRPKVMDLVRGARLDVVREGSRMLVAWKGAKPPCPVRLIHGDRDVLIRSSVVKPDQVVKGGGHLINLTHPKAVNQFILQTLRVVGLHT
ncbi:MAG TPA: alpha/beta hydrolase [Planctomycetota bacterium]|nr:alpha/beta hydrolase [Planctomycetota bacterium]